MGEVALRRYGIWNMEYGIWNFGRDSETELCQLYLTTDGVKKKPTLGGPKDRSWGFNELSVSPLHAVSMLMISGYSTVLPPWMQHGRKSVR